MLWFLLYTEAEERQTKLALTLYCQQNGKQVKHGNEASKVIGVKRSDSRNNSPLQCVLLLAALIITCQLVHNFVHCIQMVPTAQSVSVGQTTIALPAMVLSEHLISARTSASVICSWTPAPLELVTAARLISGGKVWSRTLSS